MNHASHPRWVMLSIFSPVINKFCYVKKYRYRMHFDTLFLFLWTFYESLKIVLINMIKILMVSAKMAFLCFLKIRVFWNKILSHVSNYIINVVMWPKFGKSIISMREVIKTSILLKFDQKNNFFEGWSWFKFNNLGVGGGGGFLPPPSPPSFLIGLKPCCFCCAF